MKPDARRRIHQTKVSGLRSTAPIVDVLCCRMDQRPLGRRGPSVSAIGLGCMSLGLADIYTSSVRDDDAAVALIRRPSISASRCSIPPTSTVIRAQVAQAVTGRRAGSVVATKFGFVQPAPGSGLASVRPEAVRQACDRSLQRLQLEVIDLYYLHRVDPQVPIEDTVGAMSDLVQQGKVLHLGLSEASPATVRRAHAVHPIAAVQSEYSLFSREPEDELLPALRDLGIALVAYSPLGRGFLGGRFRTIADLAPDDWRRRNPRFQGENFARNVRSPTACAIAVASGCRRTTRAGVAADAPGRHSDWHGIERLGDQPLGMSGSPASAARIDRLAAGRPRGQRRRPGRHCWTVDGEGQSKSVAAPVAGAALTVPSCRRHFAAAGFANSAADRACARDGLMQLGDCQIRRVESMISSTHFSAATTSRTRPAGSVEHRTIVAPSWRCQACVVASISGREPLMNSA